MPPNAITKLISRNHLPSKILVDGALLKWCPNCTYERKHWASSQCPECGLVVDDIGSYYLFPGELRGGRFMYYASVIWPFLLVFFAIFVETIESRSAYRFILLLLILGTGVTWIICLLSRLILWKWGFFSVSPSGITINYFGIATSMEHFAIEDIDNALKHISARSFIASFLYGRLEPEKIVMDHLEVKLKKLVYDYKLRLSGNIGS